MYRLNQHSKHCLYLFSGKKQKIKKKCTFLITDKKNLHSPDKFLRNSVIVHCLQRNFLKYWCPYPHITFFGGEKLFFLLRHHSNTKKKTQMKICQKTVKKII